MTPGLMPMARLPNSTAVLRPEVSNQQIKTVAGPRGSGRVAMPSIFFVVVFQAGSPFERGSYDHHDAVTWQLYESDLTMCCVYYPSNL